MSVLVTDEGPVRWLTLNRAEKRNALDREMVEALLREIGEAAGSGARCVAVTGAGEVFCAGLDLSALEKTANAGREENFRDAMSLVALFEAIAASPLPVVAAVNGHAMAGGAGLVAACDLAVAAAPARFGFTEVRVGFIPALILNFVLRTMGEKAARDLCLTGRRFDAAEALRHGLVNEVVAPDRLSSRVAEIAGEIRLASPAAIAATKRAFLELRNLNLMDGLRAAARMNASARETPDFREGIASFLGKRKPRWAEEKPK